MNTVSMLQSKPVSGTILSHFGGLRTHLYAMGVCWVDSVSGQFSEIDGFSMRVILYSDRSRANFENPIVAECNGLVLSATVQSGLVLWKVLCSPLPTLNQSQFSMKQLANMYAKGSYDTYEAMDATVVNLYWNDDSWSISTTKGYDVTDMIMCAGYTYKQVFESIVSHKYPEFNMGVLNPEYTYTLSIRYSSYHVFVENRTNLSSNTYITLMSAQYTSTGTNDLNEFDRVKVLSGFCTSLPVKGLKNNLNHLLSNCKNSIQSYEKVFPAQGHNQRSKGNNSKPVYGYILRTNDLSIPVSYRNVYIESSLMKLIRNGLYRHNHDNLRDGDYKMLTLSLFLNRSYFGKYYRVFHQYKDEFESLGFIIKGLSESIAKSILGTEKYEHDLVISDFISNVITQMKSDSIIPSDSTDKVSLESTCMDYIYNPKYRSSLENIIMNSDLVKLVS